jgi:ribonuclease P protein component
VAAQGTQMMVTVSKRQFHQAVRRNLIRRRTKEAFRLNKHILRENQCNIVFSVAYTAKEILPFSLLQQKIILILHRLVRKCEKIHR